MIDPRDEALFERYFAAELTDHTSDVDDAAERALNAVAKHRALFPLPAPGAPPKPATEPWQDIIDLLWTFNFQRDVLAHRCPYHPASAIEPEIARMLEAGIIYERPDKTLAIAAQYRTADPAEGMAKIAAVLGGGA